MRCTLLCAAITLVAASVTGPNCFYYPGGYDFGTARPEYQDGFAPETTNDPVKFNELTWQDVNVKAAKIAADSTEATMTLARAQDEAANELRSKMHPVVGCTNILNRTVHDVSTPCPEAPQNHLGESICQDGAVWDTVECKCKEECDDDVPDECNKPIDIAFVIDASGSIGASNYITMKEKIGQIVQGLDISANMVHIAAHAFSCSNCHLQPDSGFTFQDSIYGDSLVQQTIDALPFHSQNTYIGQAMRHTFQTVMNGGNPGNGYRGNGVPAAIIVITDGMPNPSQEGLIAKTAAEDARNKGIRVFAIGAGGYNGQNLRELACDNPNDTACTDKYVYNTNNFDVSVFKQELLNVLCADDTTTTTTTKPVSPCGCKDRTDDFSCLQEDPKGDMCVARVQSTGMCPRGTRDCTCPDDPRDNFGIACNTDDDCVSFHSSAWKCLGGNQYFTASRSGDCVRMGCDDPTIIDGPGGATTTRGPGDTDGPGGGGGHCQLCAGLGGEYHCIEAIHGHHYCQVGLPDANGGSVCAMHQIDCLAKK